MNIQSSSLERLAEKKLIELQRDGHDANYVHEKLDAERTELQCPHCKTAYRLGELICSQCGFAFAPAGKTNKIGNADLESIIRTKRVGAAIVEETKPILFHIGKATLTLPVIDPIIVGRGCGIGNSSLPDVDLTPFGADEKGVSRRHLKIVRSYDFAHVADLGSTNGSFLNGFPLLPYQERVLRSGDEVTLGRLTVRVEF